jgi:hypothetical protein
VPFAQERADAAGDRLDLILAGGLDGQVAQVRVAGELLLHGRVGHDHRVVLILPIADCPFEVRTPATVNGWFEMRMLCPVGSTPAPKS